MLSLYAASQSKAKLITKVNRIAFENVIDSMNLGSVIYPKLITSETILQYVRAMQNSMGSNVETLYKIVADRAEALEFRVANEPSIVGIPLEKLELKNNLLVAFINRKGQFISPRGKDTLEEGDRVIVVTTVTGLNDLKDILR
ncbi:MAG: TrkA C-terminal domain-containing protein, partial [Lacrimispora sphenoides]